MASYSNQHTSEPEPYLYYRHDGLMDIFLGVTLILAIAFIYAGFPWLIAIWGASLLPIWRSAKNSLTAGRLGTADLATIERVERGAAVARTALLVAMAMFALLIVLLLWFVQTGHTSSGLLTGLRDNLALILGLLTALGLGLVGSLLKMKRFFLYAGLAVLMFAAAYLLRTQALPIVALVGGIVAIGGAFVLVRFLHTHPIQTV